MTAATAASGSAAACRCGHDKREHDHPDLRPQCIARGCICLQYRPLPPGAVLPARPIEHAARPLRSAASPPTTRSPTAAPDASAQVRREPTDDEVLRGRGPTIEQILQAGKRSAIKRTVTLAEKIAVLINDLRGRLSDEREAAEEQLRAEAAREEVKKEIAQLEEQLASARAKLRGSGPTSPGATRSVSGERIPCTEPGCEATFAAQKYRAKHMLAVHGTERPSTYECPDCPETFGRPQGLALHRYHKHGYRPKQAR